MEYLIGITFRDTTLRNRLLGTHQSQLKECVRSREVFWSMVTYTGQPGQNVLGQILMDRCEFIREIQTLREMSPDDNDQTRGRT